MSAVGVARLAARLSPGLARLLATTGALALAVLPHADDLPPWVVGLFAGAVAWRLAAEHRGWALPPRWLRVVLAIAATAGVLLGYRTLNGLDAGTALLVVMAALKLAETRAPRDHAVLVFIGYFLCLSSLLHGQTLARLAYAVAACWLLTAALARVHRPVEANTPVRPFAVGARVLLLGLPLAAVLFVFVPRIEGRFWAIPQDERQARTGIDDEMSPGDIANLGLSDDPAFRAWFVGERPRAEELYWRMLVLEDFDGRTWRRASVRETRAPEIVVRGRPLEYRIAMEATGRSWLPSLDILDRWPEDVAYRGRGLQLVRFDRRLFEPRPVDGPFEYALRSHPESLVMPSGLADSIAARNVALPEGRHPRARALAAELRAASADDRDFVRRVLARYTDGGFEYTLAPPPLGADPVDEFLFDTRSGFCEHYASSFTVLMRAAGIPARVVTGYQGGERNRYGEFLLVRQSSAHAWAEVWLPGAGWTRVDPTAAVAPERVRRGVLDGATVGDEAPGALYEGFEWLADARALWDATRVAWNRNVLGFGRDTQARLLERIGLGRFGWQGLGVALAVGFALAALALAAWLAWEFRPRRGDPVDVAWARVCARLAALGHARAPHEGPLDYARRVARAEPTVAARLSELVEAYVGVRYLPASDAVARERFVALATAFVRRPEAARR